MLLYVSFYLIKKLLFSVSFITASITLKLGLYPFHHIRLLEFPMPYLTSNNLSFAYE
jgi:hypothetical protein